MLTHLPYLGEGGGDTAIVWESAHWPHTFLSTTFHLLTNYHARGCMTSCLVCGTAVVKSVTRITLGHTAKKKRGLGGLPPTSHANITPVWVTQKPISRPDLKTGRQLLPQAQEPARSVRKKTKLCSCTAEYLQLTTTVLVCFYIKLNIHIYSVTIQIAARKVEP